MASGMTRAEQRAETVYVTPDGEAFFTPDGEGRIWYDDMDAAIDEHGNDVRVIHLDNDPEDY